MPHNELPFVVWHAWANAAGQSTGVLEIVTSDKRIWSVPSLWGCPVGCTFCISSSQAYGGPITAPDLIALLKNTRRLSQSDKPVELSFTGEGEAVFNATNILALVEHLRHWPEIAAARVCVSGLRMENARQLASFPWPTRLQFSLHSAVQASRTRLIPNSIALPALREKLLQLTALFHSVDLNVVLQAGANDGDAHLRALLAFVEGTPWRVVFNPQMVEGAVVEHPDRDAWIDALRAQGTPAEGYRVIGARIVQAQIYQRMTFVPPPGNNRSSPPTAELRTRPNTTPRASSLL